MELDSELVSDSELDNSWIKELDNSWIEEFQKKDKPYEKFYLDDLFYIRIHCVYVGNTNCIYHTKEEKHLLKSPNFLSKEEIISTIKRNNVNKKIKYSVLSILKYNIDLNPEDIHHYLLSKNAVQAYPFLQPINYIDDIHFKRTISMFQDLNALYFFFYERNNKNIQTKRIYVHTHSPSHKKTRRLT